MNVRLPDQASTLTDAVAPGPVAAPSLASTVHAQVSPSEVADDELLERLGYTDGQAEGR